jgi:hypothetical protein
MDFSLKTLFPRTYHDDMGLHCLVRPPLTEAYGEDGRIVQIFERARPVADSGGVTLSPLGYWLTIGHAFLTSGPPSGALIGSYVARTRQAVAARFRPFYQAHNGPLYFWERRSHRWCGYRHRWF